MTSSTTIDALFASATHAAGKEALPRWTATSSGHAMLYSALTTSSPFSKHLITPAAMRTLPSEAITDLRRRFAYLEAIFGVPDLDLAAAWDSAVPYVPPAPVGHMPDPTPRPSAPPPAAMAAPVPCLPDLMRHGFSHMMAIVQTW